MASTYLTPRQVAELMGVSPITVRQWANRGWLPVQKTTGGHRRFRRQDVERFSRKRGLPGLAASSCPRRLLVVEDDRRLAAYLAEVLGDFPSQVETRFAFDGFEAGRLVEAWQPDTVLLDLMLPGVDGFEVCRSIRSGSQSGSTQVVAMTGFYTEDNVDRILQAGAERCLAKPFRRAELLDALGLEPSSPVSQPNGQAAQDD
ncbi:MAG: response regulator [Gammaproteobacteria bacterium]|nr:response regulator [Gammaproteobacteria bacterium]